MIQIAVFFRRHAGQLTKLLDKMALRGKGEVICYLDQRIIAVAQQIFGHLNFLSAYVRTDRIARLLFKEP